MVARMTPPPRPKLPPCPVRTRDVVRIAAATDLSTPTVYRVLRGAPKVHAASARAVIRAARELGIPLPPPLAMEETSPQRDHAEGSNATTTETTDAQLDEPTAA